MDKKIKQDFGKELNYILMNGEEDHSRFLSFCFRVLAFLFLLPALIFVFAVHSWLGFGVF